MELGIDSRLAIKVIVGGNQVGRNGAFLTGPERGAGPTPIQMPVWACDMAAPATRIQIAKAVCDFNMSFLFAAFECKRRL